jgi:hypothetical protein
MNMRYILIIALLFSCLYVQGQERKIVELSGRLTVDSIHPAAYANVLIINKHQGVSSEFNGNYHILAHTEDTVVFSYLGFRKRQFVIPADVKGDVYEVNHRFVLDTIFLKKHNVKPQGDYNQFRQAVINTKVLPDPEVVTALANIQMILTQESLHPSPASAYENYRTAMMNMALRPRPGQVPYFGFLNPIAWAKYIDFVKKQKQRKMKKMN